MPITSIRTKSNATTSVKHYHPGIWIALGLVLGILCGIFFGEYCAPLNAIGQAYVGLLQMTVLPYLAIGLIAKMGRLEPQQARKLGLVMIGVLLVLWLIAIGIIIGVSIALPPIQGATFFSEADILTSQSDRDFLSRYVPSNIFHSLAEEYVPAVVVFCLFFGFALMLVTGKEQLISLLDVCSDSLSRINIFLVRLAPVGLFMLTAAAAGTMHLEQLARLQAYLLLFTAACLLAAFVVLPLLVSCFTHIRYRDFLSAANEPLLTALATGKLFVVLPQIVEKCEELAAKNYTADENPAPPSVVVPLAYPIPHIGKILTFIFISFAAWYVGHKLTPFQTLSMGATGSVSSFASPLITIPYLLDEYQLPQDLMPLFILPGFITTRLADVVGVMHLMALSLIVPQLMQGQIRVRWRRLAISTAAIVFCLAVTCGAGNWYLASTKLDYDLDDRLLSLSVPAPQATTVVHESTDTSTSLSMGSQSTLDRVKKSGVLRVGYHRDHLPYSYINQKNELVGLDVELMHHLATRLDVSIEFIPYQYDTVVEQLNKGEVDLVIGGLIMTPERLLSAAFTQPYQKATIALLVRDHRREEVMKWDLNSLPKGLRLAVVYEDVAVAARRQLPEVDIEAIGSIKSYFTNVDEYDGLVLPAEEAAAWNILYPEYTVVVPQPVIQRPVGMAIRKGESEWLNFLDRWIDFERHDGSLTKLRKYWIEGGGTKDDKPRWCIARDLLHWIP